MQYSVKTHKGIVRSSNQDNCYVAVFDSDSCFGVVCDGMGGPNAGDVASEIAVKEIADRFTQGWKNGNSLEDAKQLLSKALKTANLRILAHASTDSAFEGMGTTVVAAVVIGNDVLVANIGDSRAYCVSDNISQVSKDHSLVQELLDRGEITGEQAACYPDKNVITRALGIGNHVEIDFYTLELNDSALLLCSDGLYNFVSEQALLQIINDNESDFTMTASALVAAANNNGGGDNVTAVIIKR